MPTDNERVNFLEMAMKRGHVSIQENNGSTRGRGRVQIFSVPSQHQYGDSAREVIDIAMRIAKERGTGA